VELAGLPGWTVQPGVATLAPVEGGWLARIRQTIVPGRTYRVWPVSLVDPTGFARYTRTVNVLGEPAGTPKALSGRNSPSDVVARAGLEPALLA
jgi:hypothetical protein